METAEYFTAATTRKAGSGRGIDASPAGWGMRCGAFLFDYILTLLVPALTLVAAVYVKRRWQAPSAANVFVAIGYLAAAAVIFFNFVYFYVLDGQSFGKRLIGLRVVRTDGAPLDYKTAVVRNIVGYPFSILFFGLGALWILWDARGQGWHDKLAKTIVVKD
jgi:uncharacterized RDD family membrane protein YckC